MKEKKRLTLRRGCVAAGILLLLVAAVVLVLWQWGIHRAARQAESYVQTLRELLPEPQGAVPEERRDNGMPALSLNGTDFVGILEMPLYDSALPVCASWGNPSQYPCCFSGSIYDRSLQIGATSQKGQYDFYRQLSVGDTLYFTDVEGNRYTYTVTDLRYRKHADQAALGQNDADLTLFIKNVFAFEYIIVFCDVPG